MKVETDIVIGLTHAGSGHTWRGKLTDLEYSPAGGEGAAGVPKTIELPGAISVPGKLKPGTKVTDIIHECVVTKGMPAKVQCKGLIHGKLEFEEALPAEIDNLIIQLVKSVCSNPTKNSLVTISDDEVVGVMVLGKDGKFTLQSRKKPGSGRTAQGRKKPGSGVAP